MDETPNWDEMDEDDVRTYLLNRATDIYVLLHNAGLIVRLRNAKP